MKPSINSEPFKFVMSSNFFKKEDIIKSPTFSKIKFNLLEFLGCKPKYIVQIIGDAIQVGSNFEYSAKLTKKIIRIFFISIWTIKY